MKNSEFRIGFLVYDSRSGSTLLSSILNTHPEILVTFELEYILIALRKYKEHKKIAFDQELFEIVNNDKRLKEWPMDFEEILKLKKKCSFDINSFTNILLQKYADHLNRKPKIILIKQGSLIFHLEDLWKFFPEAPIIHIYRDGRAVFASKKRTINIDTGLPMQKDLEKAAWRWKRIQNLALKYKNHENFFEVKYEDLVLDPFSVQKKIWYFLNVNTNPSYLLSIEDYAQKLPTSQKTIHPLVGKKCMPAKIYSWKKELSIFEIFRYEKINKEILKIRGYPLIVYNPLNFLSLILDKFL